MKQKKSQLQPTDKSLSNDVVWFVMRGFNLDDKTNTGFLSLNTKPSHDVYDIVEDLSEALKFPSKNVYGIDGFGTP